MKSRPPPARKSRQPNKRPKQVLKPGGKFGEKPGGKFGEKPGGKPRDKRGLAKRSHERPAEDLIPPQGLTNTQLCKAIAWFLEQKWSQTRWWSLAEELAKSVETSLEPPDGEKTLLFFRTEEEALRALSRRADNILRRIHLHVPVLESKETDYAWARRLATDGTLRDRFTALTALIERAPVLHLHDVEALFKATATKNRTEAMMAVDFSRDLFTSEYFLPGTRTLREWNDPTMQLSKLIVKTDDGFAIDTNVSRDSASLRFLICQAFESKVHTLCTSFSQSLSESMNDPIEYLRRHTLNSVFGMLSTKPESEEILLALLVRALGDLTPRVSSFASKKLAELLLIHPPMKGVVAKKVEELVWMQKIPVETLQIRENRKLTPKQEREKRKTHARALKAKAAETDKDKKTGTTKLTTRRAHTTVYNAVLFLSEIQYVSKADGRAFVLQMMNRYARLLIVMLRPLSTLKSQIRKRKKQMDKILRRQRRGNKDELPASERTVPLVSYAHGLAYTAEGSTIIRHVLTGVRRLLPFVDERRICSTFSLQPKTAETSIKPGTKPEVKVEQFDETADETSSRPTTAYQEVDIANQLFALVHKVTSWSTRIHGWDLLYRILKKTKRLGVTFCSNFCAQLRDFNCLESKSRNLLIRLLCLIAQDPELELSVTTRAALLRRLLSLVLINSNPPSSAVGALDALESGMSKEANLLGWIQNLARHTDKDLRIVGTDQFAMTRTAETEGQKSKKKSSKENKSEPETEKTKLETPSPETATGYDPWEFNIARSHVSLSDVCLLQASMFEPVAAAAESLLVGANYAPIREDEEVIEEPSSVLADSWSGLIALDKEDTANQRTDKLYSLRKIASDSLNLKVLLRMMHAQPLRDALGVEAGDINANMIEIPKASKEDPLALDEEIDPEGNTLGDDGYGGDSRDDLWACGASSKSLWKAVIAERIVFPFSKVLQTYFEDKLREGKYKEPKKLTEEKEEREIDRIANAKLFGESGVWDQEEEMSDREVSEEEIFEGDIASDDLAEGDISEGDISEGDISERDISEGDISEGDISEKDIAEGDIASDELFEGDIFDGDTSEGDMSEGDDVPPFFLPDDNRRPSSKTKSNRIH